MPLPILHSLYSFYSIYSRPPVSGIGLFLLPVHLQALRQAPCPKVYAKPEGTNGTHSPVLSPGASPTCETFRAPSRSNKFPDVCPGSPLLFYPFFQPLFSFLGFAVTERIILCLRNSPPVYRKPDEKHLANPHNSLPPRITSPFLFSFPETEFSGFHNSTFLPCTDK